MSSKLSLSVPFYWSSQRPRCISLPVLLLLAACLPALKKSTSQNIPWNIPNDYPVIPLYPNDIPIVGYFTRKLQQKAFDCSLAAEGPAIDRIQFGRWSPWKDPPSPWKRFHWKTKKKTVVMAVLQTLGVWGRSPRSGSIMFMFVHFDKTWCNSSWVPSCKWVKPNFDLSTGLWLGPSVHVVWLHPKVTLQDAVDQHLYQKCVIDGNLIDSLLKAAMNYLNYVESVPATVGTNNWVQIQTHIMISW